MCRPTGVITLAASVAVSVKHHHGVYSTVCLSVCLSVLSFSLTLIRLYTAAVSLQRGAWINAPVRYWLHAVLHEIGRLDRRVLLAGDADAASVRFFPHPRADRLL